MNHNNDSKMIDHFMECFKNFRSGGYSRLLNFIQNISYKIHYSEDTKQLDLSINPHLDNEIWIELESFAMNFREYFQLTENSSLNVSEIYKICLINLEEKEPNLFLYLKKGKSQWQNAYKGLQQFIIEKRINGKKTGIIKYTPYNIYDEFMYSYFVHKDPNKQEKFEDLWILKPMAFLVFCWYMDIGFRFLRFMEYVILMMKEKGFFSK